MARKSAALHNAPKPVVIPERSGTYADYPACLPGFKWLVEEALRNPEKMFNSPTVPGHNAHYCKCCGAAYKRADWLAHVNEHAEQLHLGKRVLSRPTASSEVALRDDVTEVVKVVVDEDLKLTIIEAITSRLPELQLQFSLKPGLLGFKVAEEINSDSAEGDVGDPPLCEDCQ